ncbi:MAG: sulfatase [PVC group bacterium]
MKIILIVIDALRADSLSCYGYPLETSPGIDRIVGEGVLFENAYTQANWTNPSLYSFLTGLYPSTHGVSGFNQNLGEKVTTLPGFLSGNGYRTFLFSNYYVLLDRKRLGKHFQEALYFDIDSNEKKLCRTFTDSEGSDLFAVVHVGNYIHEPYCASSREVSRFWKGAFPKRKIIRVLTEEAGLDDESMQNVLRSVNLRKERLDRKEITFLKACYDAGIRHVDAWLTGFFNFLTTTCRDDIILVITADHGQGFFEHGFFGHGLNLNEEIAKVPLIFWMSREKRGLRMKSTVQLIDVFPTLIELLTWQDPPAIDGVSFAGCLQGVEEASRWAVCEGFPFAACVHDCKKLILSIYRLIEAAERTDRLKKLVLKRRFRKLFLHLYSIFHGGLYDLTKDPGEKKNLKRSDPATFTRMEGYLRAWYKKVSACTPEVTTEKLEEDRIIEQLKSLGYL